MTDELLLGYRVPVSERVKKTLNVSASRRVRIVSALVLALGGEETGVQAMADSVLKEAPEFEILKFLMVPTVLARLALNHHNAPNAIDLLKPAAAYDRRTHFTLFLRGSADLEAGLGTEAAEEFQRILKLKSADPEMIYMPLAQPGLARALALSGDKARARSAYQDFLALWKDADPDIPLLIQAKAEYARLQ